jgi:hypothetical protein
VHQKFFFPSGRGFQQLTQVAGLGGIEGQGGDAQLTAFFDLLAISFEHGVFCLLRAL